MIVCALSIPCIVSILTLINADASTELLAKSRTRIERFSVAFIAALVNDLPGTVSFCHGVFVKLLDDILKRAVHPPRDIFDVAIFVEFLHNTVSVKLVIGFALIFFAIITSETKWKFVRRRGGGSEN